MVAARVVSTWKILHFFMKIAPFVKALSFANRQAIFRSAQINSRDGRRSMDFRSESAG